MRNEVLGLNRWNRALVICAAAFIAFSPRAGAQEPQAEVAPPSPPASPDDLFLNHQAEATLKLAAAVLKEVPPRYPQPRERRLALTLLDGALHDAAANERPAVKAFFEERMRSAVAEIQTTRVEKGARIWKLYNHGFVVRTASVTIAFDVVGALPAHIFQTDEQLMMPLVQECDALIVSHSHGDHVDRALIRAFLEAKKPVLLPPDLEEGASGGLEPLRLERNAELEHVAPIQDGHRELKVVTFPGHQEGMVCNTTLVTTPEGLGFAHTGDQYSMKEDFVWIDHVHERYRVDVLIPNCWTFGLTRMVDGFKPRLVITGHENEMAHPVHKREPYWRSFDKLDKCSAPGLVMTWGESYHYQP